MRDDEENYAITSLDLRPVCIEKWQYRRYPYFTCGFSANSMIGTSGQWGVQTPEPTCCLTTLQYHSTVATLYKGTHLLLGND